MRVLVTGAAGYIGSHTTKQLLEQGHTVVAVDNLDRGHRAPMQLLSERFPNQLDFHEADLGDADRLADLLAGPDGAEPAQAVLHFGALAYVGESVDDPLRYYRNNINAGVALLQAIDRAQTPRLIFSSSCATYGDPPEHLIPVPEHCPQNPTSPYGRTKLMFEHILTDYAHARNTAAAQHPDQTTPLRAVMLRYFNVAGSDPDGLLGEDHDPETHLIPVAIQAALGQRPALTIFGTDYPTPPTPDGTCVRDYVHVDDLAAAHVLAMNKMTDWDPGVRAYNVGIGNGFSVRQVIESVRRATGRDFEVKEGPRRPGDAVALYNDPAKIQSELGWTPRHTNLDDIVRHAWDWMSAHPNGYGD